MLTNSVGLQIYSYMMTCNDLPCCSMLEIFCVLLLLGKVAPAWAISPIASRSVVCCLSVICHTRAPGLNCLMDLHPIWQVPLQGPMTHYLLLFIIWFMHTLCHSLWQWRISSVTWGLGKVRFSYDSQGGSSITDQQFHVLPNYFGLLLLFPNPHLTVKTFLFSLSYNWYWHYLPPAPLKLTALYKSIIVVVVVVVVVKVVDVSHSDAAAAATAGSTTATFTWRSFCAVTRPHDVCQWRETVFSTANDVDVLRRVSLIDQLLLESDTVITIKVICSHWIKQTWK